MTMSAAGLPSCDKRKTYIPAKASTDDCTLAFPTVLNRRLGDGLPL
jgi:hypothetical protein